MLKRHLAVRRMHAADMAGLTRELESVLDRLEQALAAEFAALRTRDLDALDASGVAKTDALAALERISAELARHERATVTRELGALRARAAQLAAANRRNGGAIDLNRRFAERLIQILRGGAEGPSVYDAGGRIASRGGLRRVGYA